MYVALYLAVGLLVPTGEKMHVEREGKNVYMYF